VRGRWLAVSSCLLAALTFGVAACGDDNGGGGTVSGNTLTIYSSLPLQGGSRTNAQAINNGARLSLQQHGNGKIGQFTIKFKALDDSTAQAGKWDPGKTQQNARQAVQDKTTIAYLGEYNSGATTNSLPILNEAGILQVSPANTAVGLTSDEPGADTGEPDKYYPTKKRTYARVVPKDTIQGAAQANIMKEDGCKKVFIADDTEVYGAGLARVAEAKLKEAGIQVVGNEGYDPKAPNYRSLANSMRDKGTDCFFGSLIIDNNAVQMFKDVAAALPQAKLYGPDGVAETSFADPGEGGLPPNVASRVKITQATLDPDEFRPGRVFFDGFEKKYGEKHPPTYAIYGYEAMNLILDSIRDAGSKGNDRQAVIDQLFNTKGRKSVLGTYDIDQNGDTTLTDYGLYTIKNGELQFDRTLHVSG
jgi:branched-chain amino acid transport system substrate-binding protein